MKKVIKFKVKQYHIDHGIKRDCGHCPVALALRDHLNNELVEITLKYAYIYHKVKEYRYHLPKKAIDFIYKFDNNNEHNIKPFFITLTEA